MNWLKSDPDAPQPLGLVCPPGEDEPSNQEGVEAPGPSP